LNLAEPSKQEASGGEGQVWSAAGYREHASFVPGFGAALLDLLGPRSGECILDVGCGEGALSVRIAASGARVIGIDSSADMVAAARAAGIDARVMDAQALTFDREFDAVFSNAALHWMKNPDAVLSGVRRALKPGGRFIAEFGGHGCIAALVLAMRIAVERRGLPFVNPWYFPTDTAYRKRLEAHGFDVERCELFPRLTPLPTGIDGWLQTFGGSILASASEADRAAIRTEVGQLLQPVLCDDTGAWTADYVRLRVIAHLQH
jgi:SAM-dependent methyltransferase